MQQKFSVAWRRELRVELYTWMNHFRWNSAIRSFVYKIYGWKFIELTLVADDNGPEHPTMFFLSFGMLWELIIMFFTSALIRGPYRNCPFLFTSRFPGCRLDRTWRRSSAEEANSSTFRTRSGVRPFPFNKKKTDSCRSIEVISSYMKVSETSDFFMSTVKSHHEHICILVFVPVQHLLSFG